MPSSNSRPLAALGALVLSLGLPGCATLGPNYEAPAPPTAKGYAMAGDAAPVSLALSPDTRSAGPWWAAFGSAELDQVMRQALAANPSLVEAESALERARQEIVVERGVRYDARILGEAERTRINTQTFGITGFPTHTTDLFSIGPIVGYDIDLFGRRRRLIEAAEANAQAQAHRADAAYLALTGNVALQVFRIAALNAELAALHAVIEDDNRTLDIARRALQAGGASPSSLSASQAQLAEDEAQLAPVQRDLAAARHQLALLVGRSPAEWTPPDFTFADFTAPTAVPLSLPSSLVARRPDILAAAADLHTATARIGVAVAAQYPDIHLSANLTQTAVTPADILRYASSGWSIGGALSGPLIKGAALKGRLHAAEADARAAQARYQGTVLRAFVQVSDVLSALASDEQALAALARSEAAAQASLRDARSAYELGSGARLALIDAQRQLSRARRGAAQAEGRRYADLVQLFTATAADWRAEPAA